MREDDGSSVARRLIAGLRDKQRLVQGDKFLRRAARSAKSARRHRAARDDTPTDKGGAA